MTRRLNAADRYATQRNATLASNSIGESAEVDPQDFQTLAENLESLGRPLEAVTWKLFGAFYTQENEQTLQELNQKRKALAAAANAFPDQSFKLEKMSLADFAEPNLGFSGGDDLPFPPSPSGSETFPVPAFDNIAEDLKLNHTYWVASKPQSSDLLWYHLGRRCGFGLRS